MRHDWTIEAFRHATAIDDVDTALMLVERHWMRLAASDGRAEAWLDQIEPSTDGQRVTLTFVRGWLAGLRGAAAEVWHAIIELRASGDQPTSAGPRSPRAGAALLRAAFVDSDPRAGVESARSALADLGPGDGTWYATACGLLGHHLFWAGDVETARVYLEQCAKSEQIGTFAGPILVLADGLLALISERLRQPIAARRYADESLALAGEYRLRRAAAVIPARVALAMIAAEAGRLDAAAEELDRTRDAAAAAGPRYLALCLLAHARLCQLRGDTNAARPLLESARQLIAETPNLGYLEAEADQLGRRLRLRPRRMIARPDEPTDREMRVLELLAAGLSRSEMARELGVSTDTVKTHIRNLYAKLEAGTRDEALRAARDRALLRRSSPAEYAIHALVEESSRRTVT